MQTVYEPSQKENDRHISLVRYKHLNNISHHHSDHELIYVEEGNAFVTVSGTTYHLNNTDAALVHSEDIHFIRSNESAVIRVLKADRHKFEGVFGGKQLSSPVIFGEYAISRVMDEIKAELDTWQEYSEIITDALASCLFARIMKNELIVQGDTYMKQGTVRDFYSRISEKVLCDYPTVTFEEAARYMHLTPPYFSKFFHRVFGMTFTQYLNAVKISFAVEMLQSQDTSITEVAARCGFNTIRNFNRVFKDVTGYVPSKLPQGYNFLPAPAELYGVDPTLNCTEILP